jgi:hypothetical protein
MTVITEGQLTFTFPAGATACKYDDWQFYRNQFNSAFGGTKAVDLIYIDDEQTWLIEIKDYRLHERTKPSNIGDEIACKVRDTLAGLVAAKCNANDADEKAIAKRALQKNRIRLVLHLEQPQHPSRLSRLDPSKVLQKLKQRLKAIDAHPSVVDMHSLKTSMHWTVTG